MEAFVEYVLSTAPLSVLILVGVVVMLWKHHEKEEQQWLALLEKFSANTDNLADTLRSLSDQVGKMAVSLDLVAEKLKDLENEGRHQSDEAARHDGLISGEQKRQDARLDDLERESRGLDADGVF